MATATQQLSPRQAAQLLGMGRDGEPPITPSEAARRLGLDAVVRNPKLVVLKMARRGDIRAVRVSKFTMIDPASIDTYLHPDSGRRKAVG